MNKIISFSLKLSHSLSFCPKKNYSTAQKKTRIQSNLSNEFNKMLRQQMALKTQNVSKVLRITRKGNHFLMKYN